MRSAPFFGSSCYDWGMLEAVCRPRAPFPRLHVRGVPAVAWIEHRAWRHGGPDWQLWIERGGTLSRAKCQLRLEIESKLRAWLLRTCRAPLNTLSFEELRLVAEGKIREARRAHAGSIDILMHRLQPTPNP